MTDFEKIEPSIESIQFNARFSVALVCGTQIPSKDSFIAQLSLIQPDEKQIKIFCGENNKLASAIHRNSNPDNSLLICDPSEIEELKLHSRLVETRKELTEILGNFDFDSVMISEAITTWHETLRVNHIGNNRQKLIKAARTITSKVKTGKVSLSSVKFPPKRDYSDLLKYDPNNTAEAFLFREYDDASNYVRRFRRAVDNLSVKNTRVKNLSFEQADILKQILIIAEKYPSTYLYCCPFCKKYEVIEKKPTRVPKSCKPCENKYSPNNRRENHPKKNWKHDPNVRGLCDGSCGSIRRHLNSNRTCRKCYGRFS